MTPAALGMRKILLTLDLPAGVRDKIDITADGMPIYTRLSDREWAVVSKAIRRTYPGLMKTPDPSPGP